MRTKKKETTLLLIKVRVAPNKIKLRDRLLEKLIRSYKNEEQRDDKLIREERKHFIP